MTEPIEHLPPEDEADLAALADGSLYGPRRAALEARLAAEPGAGRRAGAPARRGGEADRHRAARAAEPAHARGGARGRAAGRRAPAPAAVAGRRARAGRRGRGSSWCCWPPAGRRSTTCWPSRLRPATAPAALDREFEGVRFPSYEKWRATGERTDVVDGRAVRTVFYDGRDGRVIAYAIVAGPALSRRGRAARGACADGVGGRDVDAATGGRA